MKTVMPSSSARCRTGSWGESGLAFTVAATPQGSSVRSRSAAFSAPTKLGMRPSGPGNRATPGSASAAHTSSRTVALAARSASSPPASWSCRTAVSLP
jgi:hypothetical protein